MEGLAARKKQIFREYLRLFSDFPDTEVALNLINSIKSFCEEHGLLNVILPPHVAPPGFIF